MEVLVNTEEETEHEAARFLLTCHPTTKKATIITLSGNLGAGKTVYVRGVLRKYGVKANITSPTFVFMKEYDISQNTVNSFINLIHIDAYRLEDPHMLHTIVSDTFFTIPHNIIFIEWPERIKGTLPYISMRITINILSGTRRRIKYD